MKSKSLLQCCDASFLDLREKLDLLEWLDSHSRPIRIDGKLRALAEGFNVYLLSDLIASRYRQFTRIFQMRLFQARAVPTTMGQLLLEWQTAESDAALADRWLGGRHSGAGR